MKVRLNNQVNYHQNLTNEEITGLFVSSEDSSGDFYNSKYSTFSPFYSIYFSDSNENNNSGELTSGALYKIGTVFFYGFMNYRPYIGSLYRLFSGYTSRFSAVEHFRQYKAARNHSIKLFLAKPVNPKIRNCSCF